MASAAVILLFSAVILKFTDFTKYLTNKDWNGALTQLYTWVVSVIVTLLFARSGLADSLVLPISTVSFAHYSLIAQILVGLTPGSIGSFFVDVKKSIDNSDTAAMPPLTNL